MAEKAVSLAPAHMRFPFPELIGRVAVLGGTANDKSTLIVGLALRQVRQQGTVFCVDARHHQSVEVQLRLLLRQQTQYRYMRVAGEVPSAIARTVLSVVGHSLSRQQKLPPLLLCDSLTESRDWEQTVQFLLKAEATVVELLASSAGLVFGRYDTVLLLRDSPASADALSRAVGRKVSVEDIVQLKADEGWLIHLTQVYQVRLPTVGEADE
jgi:hypothetical protein